MGRPRIFSDEERKRRESEAHKVWYRKPGVKEGRAAYAKKVRDENPIRHMYLRSKIKAKQKGIEFSISESDIVIPDKCPILDILLKFGDGGVQENSPSLDRIDNSKGYVPGNVAVISYRANNMKSNMSKDDIQRLYNYINKVR